MADILAFGLLPGGKERPKPRATEYQKPSQAIDLFLKAATELINDMDCRDASAARIAERLERIKGSFYHHFKYKAELLPACLSGRSSGELFRIERPM